MAPLAKTATELTLGDAAVQMRLAHANDSDEAILRSCVNAFISFGRSVTLVMQAESGSGSELDHWYRARMDAASESQKRLMDFFNKRRVWTIHQGEVTIRPESLPVSDVKITQGMMQNGSQGPIVHAVVEGRARPVSPGDILTLHKGRAVVWRFDDVPEPEASRSVFGLCREYFLFLRELVDAWLAERARLSDGV